MQKELKSKLRKAIDNTLKHITETGYTAIMVSGRSSFISKQLLSSYWAKNNSEQMPMLYDLGIEFNDGMHSAVYSGRLDIPYYILKTRFPDLLENKGKKVYLDDYCYTGFKFDFFGENFCNIGLINTDFAVFVSSDSKEYDKSFFAGIYDDELRDYFHKNSMSLKFRKKPDFKLLRSAAPFIFFSYIKNLKDIRRFSN